MNGSADTGRTPRRSEARLLRQLGRSSRTMLRSRIVVA